MDSRRARGKLDGFWIALAISLVFLVFSFARIAGDARSAALGGVIEVVLGQPFWGTRMGLEVILFAGSLVLVHALLAAASTALAALTRLAFPNRGETQRSLTILWLLVGLGWVFAANAAWFPRTSLGAPYHDLVTTELGGVSVFGVVTALVGALVLLVVGRAAIRAAAVPPLPGIRGPVLIGASTCLAAGVALPALDGTSDVRAASDPERPHVILIGLDSLRTDTVRQDGARLTPAVADFLAHSVSFDNALTPLARTFPAWVSIVTGRHPHTTGAFVNLLPRELIDEGPTLPGVLREHGYRTIYAIDEVRFSNLDTSYGFDDMLAPRMGATDFLLGFFADTPLANILVNTRAGAWLFPYGYANRAAYKTYDPATFIERIDAGVDFAQPTLLAAHFTLAHWPYIWADSPGLPRTPGAEQPDMAASTKARYEFAVERLDEQFGSLLDILERKGALENAIVVVLSDHGESLGEAAPIRDAQPFADPGVNTSSLFGHGTHVLSGAQYRVVLGFRSFGDAPLPGRPGRTIGVPASLEDITPTLLDALGLDGGLGFDGHTLLPWLAGDGAADTRRVRFLETEFNPPGISPDGTLAVSALADAANKYVVDPDTGRVLIRPEFIDEMLANRQYAAERGGRMLATIPAADFREQLLVSFDLATGRSEWLDAPPAAAADPAGFSLWHALAQRFEQVGRRPVVPREMLAGPADPGHE